MVYISKEYQNWFYKNIEDRLERDIGKRINGETVEVLISYENQKSIANVSCSNGLKCSVKLPNWNVGEKELSKQLDACFDSIVDKLTHKPE